MTASTRLSLALIIVFMLAVPKASAGETGIYVESVDEWLRTIDFFEDNNTLYKSISRMEGSDALTFGCNSANERLFITISNGLTFLPSSPYLVEARVDDRAPFRASWQPLIQFLKINDKNMIWQLADEMAEGVVVNFRLMLRDNFATIALPLDGFRAAYSWLRRECAHAFGTKR